MTERQKFVIRRNYGDPTTPWFVYLADEPDDQIAYFASSNQESFTGCVGFVEWCQGELAKGIRYVYENQIVGRPLTDLDVALIEKDRAR